MLAVRKLCSACESNGADGGSTAGKTSVGGVSHLQDEVLGHQHPDIAPPRTSAWMAWPTTVSIADCWFLMRQHRSTVGRAAAAVVVVHWATIDLALLLAETALNLAATGRRSDAVEE